MKGIVTAFPTTSFLGWCYAPETKYFMYVQKTIRVLRNAFRGNRR
jgi:hypothetical protein